MKKLIVAALVLLGSSAMAETVLNCVVPDSKSVSLVVDLADDQSVDFVTVFLNENNTQSVFFSQMDKGTVAGQLKNGFFNLLALTDKSAQVDGVIVNTGFMGVSKESSDTFGGFLAAKGNIYPLSCSPK